MDHLPDLRPTHFQREQIDIAKRLYAVCRLPYPGPDPLGLGLGWCCTPSNLVHKDHTDQHGRVWETPEYVGRPTSVTITPRTPRDDDHKFHRRK